jgi:hypothetical protein
MLREWGSIPLVHWIAGNEPVLLWLAAASLAAFIVTLIAVPWWLARIPPDYFTGTGQQRRAATVRHPVVRTMEMIGKNLLGFVFLLAGVAMLVLPGQGVLTILVGIILVNFPGKWRLERWIVSRGIVLRSINWLRRREGQCPLVTDD